MIFHHTVPILVLENEQKKVMKQGKIRESESIINPCLTNVLSKYVPQQKRFERRVGVVLYWTY